MANGSIPRERDDHVVGTELCSVRAPILDDDVARLVDSDPTDEQLVTVSPPESFVVAPPRRLVNHSRQRLQHELKSLRQQAIALEEQLAVITRGGRASGSRESVLLQAWRTVAADQQQQTRQAKREREQLRTAITHCKRFLKRVRRIVRERILRNGQVFACTSSRPTGVFAMEVAAAFVEIAHHLERMREQVDAVVRGSHDEIQLEKGVLCYRDAFLVPFDARSAAEAAWLSRLNRVARVSIGFAEKRTLDAENSVRRMYSTKLNFLTYTGEFHGLHETQWFVDGDRHYILHCSLTCRAARPDGSAVATFEFCNRTWIVVYPVATWDANTGPLCRVETVEYTVPTPGVRQLGQAALVESETFSRGAAAHVQQVERQLMENTLLDLARHVASRDNA